MSSTLERREQEEDFSLARISARDRGIGNDLVISSSSCSSGSVEAWQTEKAVFFDKNNVRSSLLNPDSESKEKAVVEGRVMAFDSVKEVGAVEEEEGQEAEKVSVGVDSLLQD